MNRSDLRDVYAATRAILDWDQRIGAMEADDEVGVTIISKLPAVSNFVSAMTAHTTLRRNSYALEEALLYHRNCMISSRCCSRLHSSQPRRLGSIHVT